jgi:hypothetical protein
MKQSISRELYAYWSRLKGARLAPDYNDLDFVAIRCLLANVFTIQIDRPRLFPLKMCGTRINAYWLAEQKGRSFLDLWETGDRGKVGSALGAVLEGVEPIVAGARGGAHESDALDIELLLLPLRHFGKTHSLMLGSLAPADCPQWLGRRQAPALRLHSLRVIQASDERAAPLQIRDHARRGVRNPPGRPDLVLYEGGRADGLRL